MINLAIRHGDTFYATAQFCDAQGQAASLAGYSIAARLIDRGYNLAHTFSMRVTDEAKGQYEFLPFDTRDLPAAQYLLSISYIKNDVVSSIVDLGLNLVKSIVDVPNGYAQLASRDGLTKFKLTTPAVINLNVGIWDVQWDIEWA